MSSRRVHAAAGPHPGGNSAGAGSFRTFCVLVFFNALVYISNATFTPYITTYYKSRGITVAEIGILTAIGPLVALFLQPMWGILADRTGKHLWFLRVAAAGSMLSVLFFYRAASYPEFAAVMALYSFFSIVIAPLGDAVAVGYVQEHGYRFSIVRMGGTVGYAIVVGIAGTYINRNPSLSFGLTAAVFALVLLSTFAMPGGRRKEERPKDRSAIRKILRNKKVRFVFFYAFLFQTALGFYSSFFSVFVVDQGYDNGTIGMLMCISASSEIPVLLLIDRVMKRFRLESMLMFSGFLMVVRMLLPLVPGLFFLALSQMLGGLTYMVTYYCTVMFINENLGEKLRGTGMSLLCMVQTGLASLFSNILGGCLGQAFGLRMTFLLYAAALLAAMLLCVPFLRRSAALGEREEG